MVSESSHVKLAYTLIMDSILLIVGVIVDTFTMRNNVYGND
jgi:hypothetical protein